MTVKVSSKYQVVIPEEVRHALNIQAGSKMEVLVKGKVAYLVPVPSLSSLQDELEGRVDSGQVRDKKDRF